MSSLRYLTLTTTYQVAAVIFLTGLSTWLWPMRSVAVFAGGALMAANFWALRFLAARAILGKAPKLAAGIALVSKFVIVAGLMAFCILVLRLDVLGFAVGMSSLLVGVFLAMVHQASTRASMVDSSGPVT